MVNGTSNTVLSNITIGGIPNSISINSITNTIYVASPETDKVYVIDGFTDRLVDEISVGPNVGDMAIDTSEFGGFGAWCSWQTKAGVQFLL